MLGCEMIIFDLTFTETTNLLLLPGSKRGWKDSLDTQQVLWHPARTCVCQFWLDVVMHLTRTSHKLSHSLITTSLEYFKNHNV